ncbi:MAG: transcription termination factor Rho [Desulfobacteraceae bacterium]|nr:transcription termination factor Rho [Desulfobacteraceae bacterium]
MEPVNGYLEILDKGFGFLRNIEGNFQPENTDTFVPAHLITKYSLSEGVHIHGSGVTGHGKNQNFKLDAIDTINGLQTEVFADVVHFQQQTSVNPSEKLMLSQGPDDLMGRALDMIVPIGKGQRGLIISPPKSGKTTILQHMANSLILNHPDLKVFILLVDERPEEVTDFKRGIDQATVLYSSADRSLSHHMRMTRLAMHTAIRCAEIGQDTVVFIDSLTRMSRAFNTKTNSRGRTLTGGLGANALEFPRKIFGAARNIENGGSLTIIATILVDTGSKLDDIIYQEFKGTGNMDLLLDRKCAEQRIWPAIDINASGTRKEDLLVSPEDLANVVEIRRSISHLDNLSAMSAFLEYLNNKSA